MFNMITNLFTVLVVMLIMSLPSHAASLKLRYVTTVYSDNMGKGFRMPEGVACRDNNLVVADTENKRLLRFSFNNKTLEFKSQILLPKSYPLMVETNAKGEIFVLDGRDRRIMHVSVDGVPKGYLEFKNIPGSGAGTIKSFIIDGQDNFYILDLLGGRVLVLNSGLQFEKQLPFPNDAGFISDVAVTAKGDILLLDSVGGKVYAAASDSKQFTPFTKSLKEYMNFATHLAVDDRGIVYLSDQNGSGIVMIGQDGSFLGRQSGMGWEESLLHYPAQICVSSERDVFVADRNNNRVQIFSVVEK